MITCTEFIDKTKFIHFHEILCDTGGRYLSNPVSFKEKVYVHYSIGDSYIFYERWNKINSLVIKETVRKKTILNRILSFFKR